MNGQNDRVVTKIPLSDIFSDADFNCRDAFDENSLEDLLSTIPTQGLHMPIEVRPYKAHTPGSPYRYKIVSGHRRFMAMQILKMPDIPAFVIEGLSELDAITRNATENLARKGINIVEEAKPIAKFRAAGLSLEDIAKRLGQLYGWVQVRDMLNQLPEDVQEQAKAGVINQANIRYLYKFRAQPMALRNFVQILIAQKKERESSAIDLQKMEQAKKEKAADRRSRSMTEISEMNAQILELFGESLTTRLLAWATGSVSQDEIHEDIRKELGDATWKPKVSLVDELIGRDR